ncbi:queuosine precursor transporter [Methanogenium marinum]|uniref:Probable queuosine precursor transporter n=1 Tax=Methanogenium marinum TaxID=348610 RepID=A0A9Q4KUD7_9EURY|nr:queuosine precursor transporter [Methanogenium marinum]MDE4908944.1 queuosine precursor transporter [Methanogenium marinum]
MTFPVVWIYWAISLTIVTYAAAWMLNNRREYGYAALVAIYAVYLAASQILAARVVEFDIGIYVFIAPAAVFIYPFISQAIDMINEVYGMKRAQIAIFIAFITQVLLVIFFVMTNSLTPAPFFAYEEAWQEIFTFGIRLTVASWISFLITQTIDTRIFAGLKKRYEKRIILRSVSSDAVGLTLDSIIFVTIAFAGVAPLLPLIIGQIVAKNIIGFLDTPWFVWYKKMLEDKPAPPKDQTQ